MPINAEAEPNPYAPAKEVDAAGVDVDALLPQDYVYGEPILYSGRVNDDDLDNFLRKSAPRGLIATLFVTVFLFAAVYVAAVHWQWQLLLCGIGLAVIGFTISLSPYYRRRQYTDCSDTWDAPVTGSFDASGFHVADEQSEQKFLWPSISNAYADTEILAFQSAMQPSFSRLFTPSMFRSQDDWDRLVRLATAIHDPESDSWIVQQRIEKACRLLTDPKRKRCLPIPTEGIGFAGPLTADDIPFLSPPDRGNNQTLQITLDVLVLLGLTMILSAIAGLLIDDANPLDLTLIFGVLGSLIFGLWLRARTRKLSRSGAWMQLIGSVDPEFLILDYNVCWRRVRLSSCRLESVDGRRVVLREQSNLGNTTLRRDMFADQSDWQKACQMLAEGCKA